MKMTRLDRKIHALSEVTKDLLHTTDPAARKSVLLLIAHTCGLKQKQVKRVLIAASELGRKYAPHA